jgi:hypothetical protein
MNVMLMLKRVLAGALSSTLILLSVALFPPNALADGSNQAAAHFDWSGVTLSQMGSISQSFTPHSVPSKSEGQADWSLNLGNSPSNLAASVTLQNTGTVIWQFLDVPNGSRVMSIDTATCQLQSGNAFGTPGASRSICWAPLQAVAGETYTFTIKYWDNNGSKWWNASVNVQSTGKTIQLGSLENNATNSVMNASLNMNAFNQTSFYKVPLPPCREIPNFSITYGSLKNSGFGQPAFSGTRNSTACPAISNFNLGTPGKFRLDIGAGAGGSISTNPSVGGSTSTSSTTTTNTSAAKKVSVNRPSFSLINVVGNKLNLSVNIGNAGSGRPDTVYLVAPKLGILDSNRLFGNISGSKASWSIDFDKLLSGTSIPLKVVGVKNGVESDPVEQNFNAPDVTKLISNASVPLAPKNVKSRIVGTSAVITAESTVKANALATSAYIFGEALGVPSSQAILGDVIGTKVLFEVPLKSSMAGKTFPYTVYFQNEVGKSQPVQSKLVVPAAPKIPSGTFNLPEQTTAPRTIFCVKGSQTRTFAAKSCPPGWKNA